MSVFDPDPNVRTLDRGANNVVIDAATVAAAFTAPDKPAASVAYGRTAGPRGVEPANMTFQVNTTGAPSAAAGNFIGSNDLQNWYSIGTYSGAGIYPIAGVTPRYVSASLDTLTGGTAPTVTISVV